MTGFIHMILVPSICFSVPCRESEYTFFVVSEYLFHRILPFLCQNQAAHLVQEWFHGSFPGVSVCALAYSIGNPPGLKIPFFSIATRYSLPPSLCPGPSNNLKASHASCMLLYILFENVSSYPYQVPESSLRAV